MSLFGPAARDDNAPDPLSEALQRVDPDALSPREAHALVYELKRLLGEREH
jgi:hypothetical protein